jgi:molybdate transport system substrate-binding protein
MSTVFRIGLVAAGLVIVTSSALGKDVQVMTSGAFTQACIELSPEFERKTSIKVKTVFGPSMGNTAEAIPSRMERGEPVDVIILASSALEDLIKRGKVRSDSRVDLVRSAIGIVVRAGAPKPDISSVDALKRTLLAASSIAYSDSASGVYIGTELFQRLGIAEQVKGKTKKIEGTPVGVVVARGDAQIGFQQISELLPVPGVQYVGPLPAEVQKVTIFSAGIAVGARNPDSARALIEFLKSPAAAPTIKSSGLELVTLQNRDKNTWSKN